VPDSCLTGIGITKVGVTWGGNWQCRLFFS